MAGLEDPSNNQNSHPAPSNGAPTNHLPVTHMPVESTLVSPSLDPEAEISRALEDLREAILSRFASQELTEEIPRYLSLSVSCLPEQLQHLRAEHPMRGVIADVAVDIANAHGQIKSLPDLAEVLCDTIYDPATNDVTKFVVRELAKTFEVAQASGAAGTQLTEACVFAEHMVTLRSELSVDNGPTLQADLERITTDPLGWRALLSHIIECEVVESNRYYLVPILLRNVNAGIDRSNLNFLEELAGDPGTSLDNSRIAQFLLGEVPSWELHEEQSCSGDEEDRDFPCF